MAAIQITLLFVLILSRFVVGPVGSIVSVFIGLVLGSTFFKDQIQAFVSTTPQGSEMDSPLKSVLLKLLTFGDPKSHLAPPEVTSPLRLEWQTKEWATFEEKISDVMQQYLDMSFQSITLDSLVLFLPQSDTTYKASKFVSSSKNFLPYALIQQGNGLLGGLLKDGIVARRFTVDGVSQNLPYYHREQTLRNVMLAPVKILGRSGFVIADRAGDAVISDVEMMQFTSMAQLLGTTLSYGYRYCNHQILHQELSALSAIENSFAHKGTTEALLDELLEAMFQGFGGDQITISLRMDSKNAQIVRQCGNFTYSSNPFSLEMEGLVSYVYKNSESFTRHYSSEIREVRYCAEETSSQQFRSFIALPLILDSVEGVVLIESKNDALLTSSEQHNLKQIIRAAATSLGRLQIMEHTNNLAIRDGLTGLYNHRQFQTMLHDALVRSNRMSLVPGSTTERIEEQHPVALALCDIDFFKKCNDIHGHQFGDTVLKEVSQMLEKGVRTGVDAVARYGGEEFALILSGSSQAEAYSVINRLREVVGQFSFTSPTGEQVSVTLSFGIAMYNKDASEQTELIRKADKAMYRAKENGRNRVELYAQ